MHDPSAFSYPSSQPPQPWCCDDHLNSPNTLRSNLTVGLPIDLLVYRTDGFGATLRKRLTKEDAYFRMIREGWSAALRQAYLELPRPDWVPG